MYSPAQKYAAECLGTAILLATVIGSGIMGESLSGGNEAIALLGNTIATGAILVVLIECLGPISGAHFNPVVTLSFWMRKELNAAHSLSYVCAQIIGGLIGVWAAHYMFQEPIIQISENMRSGPSQAFSEGIAAFGLVFAILAGVTFRPKAVPMIVGLYITAAYWFTASTSFANPAVTIARALSDTFAGIRPVDVPVFIIAQIIGAVIATALCGWLLKAKKAA